MAEGQEPLEVLKINVEFELKTGIVRVSGHIDNTDLCMKVLIEAAHVILARNSERDKAAMQQQSKNLEIIQNAVKLNGKNEDSPSPAIN